MACESFFGCVLFGIIDFLVTYVVGYLGGAFLRWAGVDIDDLPHW